MSVETKRIYKIEESDFYGITQGTRPIIDNEGNITGEVQNPVATIRYEDRLLVVEPYQVEFVEEQESDIAQHQTPTRESIIVESISGFAQQVIGAKIGSEYEEIGKGYKQLRIVWRV